VKRVLLVVLAFGLFACSKEDQAPPPLSVDPTAPAAFGSQPSGDACVDACVAKYPSATAAFQALDDCVVDSCQPIEESPSGGSCAAVGAGATHISYGTAATDSCMATTCCDKVTACADDPACLGLSVCMDTCNAR
jgi:hypothetical protein